MAVVAKGALSNLITGYTEGEDANQNYGRHHWLAQTFTLDNLYAIFRCRLKSWTSIGGRFYEYALRATDPITGKPTGADLATTTLSPTGEFWRSPGKWRRFDFSFPQLAAGTYALIARVPSAATVNDYKLRSDTTAPTYPLGKAWESNDSGVTWTEIPTTDLMFDIWGYQPPPEPPPPDVVKNWAPLNYSRSPLLEGFTIVVTTDIPVHLFMRWTNVEPRRHPLERFRRGIRLMDDTRYCFVSWEENEQVEPGDTLTHTFIKTNWEVCETRYFYFIGTKVTEESPSASPIFQLHRSLKDVPLTYGPVGAIVSNRTIHRQHVNWDTCHDSPTGTVADWHNPPNYQLVAGAMFIMLYDIYRSFITFDTSGIPPGSLIIEATLSLFVDTTVLTSDIGYPHICISEGVQSDPVVPEDYGNQLPYTTIGGQLDIGAAVINQYNDIAFNQDGLAWILPAGFTKLCIRQEMDIVDSRPPLGQNHILYSSAQKGEGFKPLLTVYYMPP